MVLFLIVLFQCIGRVSETVDLKIEQLEYVEYVGMTKILDWFRRTGSTMKDIIIYCTPSERKWSVNFFHAFAFHGLNPSLTSTGKVFKTFPATNVASYLNTILLNLCEIISEMDDIESIDVRLQSHSPRHGSASSLAMDVEIHLLWIMKRGG